MQVTFLGTNGWYDTPTGNTCSVLVQAKEYDILFDAGNGIAKVDRYITQEKPVYLFISHLHIDHIAGLHTLVKLRLKKGLRVFVQPGNAAFLNRFVADPFTVPFSELPYPAELTELEPGIHQLPFTLECLPLVHPAPTLGYRLEIDGKAIAYCLDTGVCENAVHLARDADLLITECTLRPDEESPGWPHLNPADAIGMAKTAGAGRLALTHFGAGVYRTLADREELRKRYETECPGLVVATDNLTIDV